MSKLTAALASAARGFRVFPLAPNAKAPALIRGYPDLATTDPARITEWWTKWPNANIGIVADGLTILDVDVKKDGDASLFRLDQDFELPATLTTRTPTGGRHIFLRGETKQGVDILGRGLDTRSGAGGYVVAPGSTVPAGTYEFVPGIDTIADAPEWLVQKLGVSTIRVQSEKVNVPDAIDAVVDRAREWLKTAERSVKGQGGDQAAFRVAARLRDLGVSELQAGELMRGEEWDYGCGWRDGWLEAKPIRSAYRYASGEVGSKAALPDDFPTITAQPAEQNKRNLRTVQFLHEFADPQFQPPPYLVKGLLNSQSYALMYGAPGEGKTFTALDISYHVAAGRPWMGHRVRPGLVLYLPYEGAGGMRKRAQALRQHYGDAHVPLAICPTRANLRTPEGRAELGALIAQLPEKPALIVFDTFAHALCGGDENSAQDVGAFNSGVQALIDHTKACVLVLHHPGKNSANGARGSSALLGAVDTEIEVADRQVRATKQRDIELGDAIGFKLTPITVGIDDDGDDISSCVVEPAKVTAKMHTIKPESQPGRAFKVLCDARPTNDPITEEEWKQKCSEFLPPGRSRGAWFDIKVRLAKARLITIDESGLIRRMLA